MAQLIAYFNIIGIERRGGVKRDETWYCCLSPCVGALIENMCGVFLCVFIKIYQCVA